MDPIAEVPTGPQTSEQDVGQPGASSSGAVPGTPRGLLIPISSYKGNWVNV